MRRYLYLLPLLVLLALPAKLALAYSGPLTISGSTWGSQSSPIAVEPGSTFSPYTIYLTNAGEHPVVNATVELNVTYPLEVAPGAPSRLNFTLIPPGATVPATFYLNVSPYASDAVYNLTAFVNYTVLGLNGTSSEYNFTRQLQAPVTLYAKPTAYLAYWGSPSSPGAAYPGMEEGVLTVVVANAGTGPAYGVVVKVSAGWPISLITDEVEVGTLPPGAQVPVSLAAGVALNATTGEYPINVTIDYNSGLSSSSTVYVPVSLAPSMAVQGYGIAQGKAFPGDEDVVLEVYLVNVGNATAQDVSARLELPWPLEPAYPGSTQEVVGSIPPGQPVPLTFRFDVPSSASSPADLNATLIVSYLGGNSSFVVPIRVSSLAKFEVTQYSAQRLTQGASNVKLSYSILNEGNVTAKFVSAQLVLPNELSGNTFTYVGDLRPGESGLAVFSVDVSSGAPVGNYTAIIELTWVQSNAPGRQFTQEIPVTLSVGEGYLQALESWATSAAGLELIAIVVVAAVAAALAAALVRARRSG